MTKRLIFFSGGVESTALLTFASKEDIIAIVPPISTRFMASVKQEKALKILAYFGLRPSYPKFEIPIEASAIGSIPMIWICGCISIMWCRCDTDITDVWVGTNSGDVGLHNQDYHNKFLDVFPQLLESAKISAPLFHLSKRQQWDMIPTHVRPYVHSCFQQHPCGVCRKCLERTSSGIPV